MSLSKEEYIEQRFLFKTFLERLNDGYSSQEILYAMKSELLATVNLPMAVDFLLAEIKLKGVMADAMGVMNHYFTPFQTFVVREAEREEGGRFDFKVALQILERLAGYMAENPSRQGVFFYQLETISRNRLGYDYGLDAIAKDPIYDDDWRYWINVVLRRQIGIIDLASLIYVRSDYYRQRKEEATEDGMLGIDWDEEDIGTAGEDGTVTGNEVGTEASGERTGGLITEGDGTEKGGSGKSGRKRLPEPEEEGNYAVLFGEREGRIAWASRYRDPAFLFSALNRHLGYPRVPRPLRAAEEENQIPALKRRITLLESRLQLLDEELRGGVNLERFYVKDDSKKNG